MLSLALCCASLVLLGFTGASRLSATCSFTSGCSIMVDGKLWSASNITQVRAAGQWCLAGDGSLKPQKTQVVF